MGYGAQERITGMTDMSALTKHENVPIALNSNEASLDDRLLMIDAAYTRGNRETCIRIVNDLYSLFDVHE